MPRKKVKLKEVIPEAAPEIKEIPESGIEETEEPFAGQQVTELEAMKFAKLTSDNEAGMTKLQLLQAQLEYLKMVYEKHRLQFDINTLRYQAENQKLQSTIESQRKELGQMQPAYNEFVKTLANKYNIDDPKNMVIDPDTLSIRDLSQV